MSQDFPEQKKLKILVVDDHELFLGGTLDVLSKQYPEAEIITVQTAQDAVEQLQIQQPDLAVVDLSIPEKPGMTGQAKLTIMAMQFSAI